MTNSPGLVSESCHESTFKLIRHHNFNDVLFSVGATWTFVYDACSKHFWNNAIFHIESICHLAYMHKDNF